MKDFQVVSSLTQLKALVAGLYGRIDALVGAAAPTVDFAVDMFDREDQDTLGDYWSNTDYVIRGGKMIRSTGTRKLLADAVKATSSAFSRSQTGQYVNPSISMSLTVDGVSSAIGEVIYKADLTSPDFTCETVTFSPAQPPMSPSLGPQTVQYIEPYPTPSDNYVLTGTAFLSDASDTRIAANGGVCIANSSNAAEGFSASIYEIPTLTANSSAIKDEVYIWNNISDTSSTSATLPGVSAVRTRYGNSATTRTDPPVSQPVVTESNVDSDNYDCSSSNTIIRAACADGVASLGNNTSRAVALGETVTMTLNGAIVFQGIPSKVSRKSRSRAGITTPDASITEAALFDLAKPFGGVTSFKVWRNDIPEPPNESGHGTYVNGRWQYADKYHTPNTDAEGSIIRNEDGTVASYTYDPEA